MALSVNALINQIAFNYITCNYSSNILQKVSTVADIAFHAHWYEFPDAQQKLFRLVIKRAQKPIYLNGYSIISCSMETFLAVGSNMKFPFFALDFFANSDFFCSFLNQPFRISSSFVDSVKLFSFDISVEKKLIIPCEIERNRNTFFSDTYRIAVVLKPVRILQ